MIRFLTVTLVVLVGLAVYVRFAPSNPAVWNVTPPFSGIGDYATAGAFRAERKMAAPVDVVLTALSRQALATPRTKLLAGSVELGKMTFVTRSRVFGFPDYTTVAVQDEQLVVYGRARFGLDDMGVNRVRVLGWLDALGPLTDRL